MRKTFVAALVAGVVGLAGHGHATPVTLEQIIGPGANGTFPNNDCRGAGGFPNCFATQQGTQQGAPTDPALLGSQSVYKLNSVRNSPTGSEDFGTYSSIDGSEFTIVYNAMLNQLSFSYTPDDLDDPEIHYYTAKQANGFVLFYDPTPITSGIIELGDYFQGNPGWSHISFFNSGGGGPDPIPAPEPASLALFGLGLAGLGLARRRRNARG